MLVALAMERANAGHVETTADFDVIAARKILILGVPEPPRNVDVHAAHAVGIVAGKPVERGNVRAEGIADAIGEIAADHAGAVRESIGMAARFRIEEQSSG